MKSESLNSRFKIESMNNLNLNQATKFQTYAHLLSSLLK